MVINLPETVAKPGQNVRLAAIGLFFVGAFFLGFEMPRTGTAFMIATAPVAVCGLMMDRTLTLWMRLMFSVGAVIGIGLVYLYATSN